MFDPKEFELFGGPRDGLLVPYRKDNPPISEIKIPVSILRPCYLKDFQYQPKDDLDLPYRIAVYVRRGNTEKFEFSHYLEK